MCISTCVSVTAHVDLGKYVTICEDASARQVTVGKKSALGA